MKKSKVIDMCEGPLISKMILFSLPLMVTGLMKLMFNATDMIIVGRFVGSNALGAVGAVGSLIHLLVSVFMGLSVGANVLVARYQGGKKPKDVSQTVHTALLMGAIGGLVLTVVGLLFSRLILTWMGTPPEMLSMSALYLKIYFAGMPFMLVYDFGSSILRAIGDTKRPLYFLLFAGAANVLLDLLLVVGFKMGVAGAAIATVCSQIISLICLLVWMSRLEGACHLSVKLLRINKSKMQQILRIGLPAGLQGAVFSFSNVLIQSSINSFGSIVVAGNTAAMNIEGFIYMAMNSFYHTAVCFTSQNFGAGKFNRIDKVLRRSLVMVFVVGASMGGLAIVFGEQLLSFYTSDPEVIRSGLIRMSVICTFYFLCGMMEVLTGTMRGIGYSVLPMIVSLLGACGFRIIWILTVFQWNHTQKTLYASYPVSWMLTVLAHLICYLIVRRKMYTKTTFTPLEQAGAM